ncbi:hypothetical protein MKEN_00413100 [Mycena kentingensis (nom. inval.)]|nr:hypothetical protein MKEN_00413100 [Mycena kentingensis (nom. inval.)]
MSYFFEPRLSAPGDAQGTPKRVSGPPEPGLDPLDEPPRAIFSAKSSLLQSTLTREHMKSNTTTTDQPDATRVSGSTSAPHSSPGASKPASHQFSSQESEHKFLDINAVRRAVADELSGSWIIEDGVKRPLHERLVARFDADHPEVAKQVESWLSAYEGYDNEKGWVHIDRDATVEKKLYKPICDIIEDVMDSMAGSKQMPSQQRRVHISANKMFTHNLDAGQPDVPGDAPTIKSCPDLVIVGSGPCCSEPETIPAVCRYSDVLTPVEIKLDTLFNESIKHQVSVYARETFVQQPSRSFVRVPLMNAHSMRIVHFDRTGGQVSSAFNYHSKAGAILLVKLIMLLASYDESEIGYDPSIYWKKTARGYRRVIKLTPECIWNEETKQWDDNVNNVEYEYEVVGVGVQGAEDGPFGPIFRRRSIRSRATTCWLVRRLDDTDGQILFVKDYWMAHVDGRLAESVFLRALKGIAGVAQVEMWQDLLASVREFRCLDEDEQLFTRWLNGETPVVGKDPLLPRSLMRIVSEKYGNTLEKAETVLELLEAARNIVCGLRDAFLEKNVVHCDISFNNLLLSRLVEGPLGVVIDYDMATFLIPEDEDKQTPGDARTGTRAFQSIKLLLQNGYLGPHDTLDDLESVFYVLCYICYGFDRTGKLIVPAPEAIESWVDTNLNATQLGSNKRDFMNNVEEYLVSRYTHPQRGILSTLLQQMAQFFAPRLAEVRRARIRFTAFDAGDNPSPPTPLKYSRSQAQEDFARFLALIDASIADLKALPAPAPLAARPATPKRKEPSDSAPQDSESPNARKMRKLKEGRRITGYAYTNASVASGSSVSVASGPGVSVASGSGVSVAGASTPVPTTAASSTSSRSLRSREVTTEASTAADAAGSDDWEDNRAASTDSDDDMSGNYVGRNSRAKSKKTKGKGKGKGVRR